MAVRALGLVREPSQQDSIIRWLVDPSAAVRSSAVLLLADYPALATHKRFVALSSDKDVETRISTAYAIGFAKLIDDADVLSKLLSEEDVQMRHAAAVVLLSFSPKDERISKIYHDNLSNKEFGVMFEVALCQENPAANLDLLIQAAMCNKMEDSWMPLQNSAAKGSRLLYEYQKALPGAELQSSKYNRALDALEIGLSFDPDAVYALEVKDGLTDRAKKFRSAVKKKWPGYPW